MEFKLRYYGDPILRRPAAEVRVFDPHLRRVVEAMLDTMDREQGVGLAAPQVGIAQRVVVALQMKTADDFEAEPIVIVNPEITHRSRETWVYEEGCLSIPGVRGEVTRPARVTVRYLDLDGQAHTIEADGMYARVLQHEIDHLDGRLFIDYLSPGDQTLIKPQLKQIAARHSA